MRPIVNATDEQTETMSLQASAILDAIRTAGYSEITVASVLVGALRVQHEQAPLDFQLELERYLVLNLEQMRKAHQ